MTRRRNDYVYMYFHHIIKRCHNLGRYKKRFKTNFFMGVKYMTNFQKTQLWKNP